MKKQEELDHLMTINHRRKSEISKGDEGSEIEESLTLDEQINETILEGDI